MALNATANFNGRFDEDADPGSLTCCEDRRPRWSFAHGCQILRLFLLNAINFLTGRDNEMMNPIFELTSRATQSMPNMVGYL